MFVVDVMSCRLVLPSAAVGVIAASSFLVAGASARDSTVRTVSTKRTVVTKAGTFRTRVTRLSARRLRVTMVLRVRGRRTSMIGMTAFACRDSQTDGPFCAESSEEKAATATLKRGRHRIQRTVVVTYPSRTRAACAQADVIATRADGRITPLLRDNPSGGRGTLVCPH